MAGTLFRVIPTDIKAFVIGTNGGNFDQDNFTKVGNYLEYYRDDQGYSISAMVAYGYTSSYTRSDGSSGDVIFDIVFTPDPSVIPPAFNLYAWKDPNGLAIGSFVYTASTQPKVGDTVYNAAGTATNTVSHCTINSTTGKVTSIIPTNASLAWSRAKAVNDIIVLPEHLYAYTNPNASSETLYAWDVSDITSGTIPSTIYTKTETIDASTEYFNADGSQLDITTITYNKFTVSGFKWFSTDPVSTITFDCG